MRSVRRKLGNQIKLKRDSVGRWIWEETVQHEIDKAEVELDIEGARGELERIEPLISYWRKVATEAENDVDRIGARDEANRLQRLAQELRERIRGLQGYLGVMRGESGTKDTPDRMLNG